MQNIAFYTVLSPFKYTLIWIHFFEILSSNRDNTRPFLIYVVHTMGHCCQIHYVLSLREFQQIFFTACSWEKYAICGAARNFFGPSYFVMALKFRIKHFFHLTNQKIPYIFPFFHLIDFKKVSCITFIWNSCCTWNFKNWVAFFYWYFFLLYDAKTDWEGELMI